MVISKYNRFEVSKDCRKCVCSICKKRNNECTWCDCKSCSDVDLNESEIHYYCRDLELDYQKND